jgi:PAS domain S-box-containing protein
MAFQKRFASFLLTTIVSLVTLSVVLISTGLFVYFNQMLRSEFNSKLLAQKGQAELLLKNRIAEIKRQTINLSFDNTIRVTMMLGVTPQLQERLEQLYPAHDGMYLFVQNIGEKVFYPLKYPDLPKEEIVEIFANSPAGEFFVKDGKERMIWLFTAPIMRQTERLGTAFAIYDLAADQQLLQAIQRTTGSEISIIRNNTVHCLDSGTSYPIADNQKEFWHDSSASQLIPINDDHVVAQLQGFTNLFFVSSFKMLLKEKNKFILLIILFSFAAIGISVSIAVFLGKQMAKPLQNMTEKAIRISEGKEASFVPKKSSYWEFDQLSQAFYKMLVNLEDEKKRYEDLLENINDAVYLIDAKGTVVNANEAAYLLLGYAPEVFFYKNIREVLPEEDVDFLVEQLCDKRKSIDQRQITFETSHKRNDESLVPVEINARAIVYEGQEVILCVARDLSLRKEAEKALRESEEKYRSILENIEECYFEVDFSGKLIFFNRAMREIWGLSEKELMGLDHRKLATKESAEELSTCFDSIYKTGKPARIDHYKITTRDGQVKTLALAASLIKGAGGASIGLRCFGRDVTKHLLIERERGLLAAQLQHAQKMEAIGTLAGGIAHDFNNILAAILGYADLAMLETDKESAVHNYLGGIRKGGVRAKDLVAQILAFSRKQEIKRQALDISPIIKEALTLLRASLPSTIEIHQHIENGLGNVLADPTMIHQILMNLGTNAAHAMAEKGGILDVTLSEHTIGTQDAPLCPNILAGSYLTLCVKDSGQGMESHVMERVFEPFFTTKEKTQGTGMGLAAVHGIVEGHGGCVTVESEVGKGTTFNLFFPVSTQQPDIAKQDIVKEVKGGKGLILFVDDEEDIIELGQRMLEYLGYDVVTTKNGNDALQHFLVHPDKFDLVITDQTMPGMTGVELSKKILEKQPNLPIILCTGYSETVNEENAKSMGIKHFMMKPFAFEDLAEAVHNLMAEKTQ